jgi:hypothetical protein
LVAMALHVAADHDSVEDVQGRKQAGGSVSFVIVGHGPARPFFIGRPGWVRSRAWIWLFPSMDRTTACAGGST